MWEAPISCPEQAIEPSWIDYNGHLNMAFYHVLFDRAVDNVYDRLGIGAEYVRNGSGSCFTMEVHVNYLNELVLEDRVSVSFQLIDFDTKRLHFFEQMHNLRSGALVSTAEQLALHVDMKTRRSAPFPEKILGRIESLALAHADLPRPPQVGGQIGIRRKIRAASD